MAAIVGASTFSFALFAMLLLMLNTRSPVALRTQSDDRKLLVADKDVEEGESDDDEEDSDDDDEDDDDGDEDEDSDDDDEEEVEEEEDVPRKMLSGGAGNGENDLDPYPQLQSAGLGLGLSCDPDAHASVAGWTNEGKDPRDRRRENRRRFEREDNLTASWEQQVTHVHAPLRRSVPEDNADSQHV